MAPRTDPMRTAPYLLPRDVSTLLASAGGARLAGICVVPGRTGGRGARLSFRGNQLVEPAHFPFDRLQAVPLQLEGVAVHPLPRPGQGSAEALQPLLEPAATALQDAEPDVRV